MFLLLHYYGGTAMLLGFHCNYYYTMIGILFSHSALLLPWQVTEHVEQGHEQGIRWSKKPEKRESPVSLERMVAEVKSMSGVKDVEEGG